MQECTPAMSINDSTVVRVYVHRSDDLISTGMQDGWSRNLPIKDTARGSDVKVEIDGRYIKQARTHIHNAV
jgi:hypothetical protein